MHHLFALALLVPGTALAQISPDPGPVADPGGNGNGRPLFVEPGPPAGPPAGFVETAALELSDRESLHIGQAGLVYHRRAISDDGEIFQQKETGLTADLNAIWGTGGVAIWVTGGTSIALSMVSQLFGDGPVVCSDPTYFHAASVFAAASSTSRYAGGCSVSQQSFSKRATRSLSSPSYSPPSQVGRHVTTQGRGDSAIRPWMSGASSGSPETSSSMRNSTRSAPASLASRARSRA